MHGFPQQGLPLMSDGAAPMKVEIGGRGGETPSGKRTPGGRKNKGGVSPGMQQAQASAFGVPGAPMPLGVDQATINVMNMQHMMVNPAMAQACMGFPAINPYLVPGAMPPMFPGGMYNPMAGASLPAVSAPTMPLQGPGVQKGCGKGNRGAGGGGGACGGHHHGGNNNGEKRTRQTRRSKKQGSQDRASSPDLQDGGDNPDRSPALNQVRREGTKSTVTLPELMPHVLEFARDQLGSRFLQAKLDDADADQKQEVFEAIKPQVSALANDAFGNFVVQKYFDVGTVEQKKQLVQELYSKLLYLANEAHGCRVVQKAIQHVPRESQLVVAEKLKENVVLCVESMHGNHVIQKCIEQMPPDSVTFIIQAVEAEAQRMATHVYGCRVVQRLLEHCASHQLQSMLDRILGSIESLSMDPYGNYVVQHMLEHGRVEDKRAILAAVERNIVDFSKNKCSSNVVEKALEVATVGEHAALLEAERAGLLTKVIGDPGDPNPPLRQMMDDRFGNFIVQRLIEHSRGPERDRLRNHLDAAAQHLQGSVHGRHILNALKKEIPGV